MPLAIILRNKLNKLMVAETEVKIQALRLITKDKSLPLNIRMKAQLELQSYPRYARSVAIRNRCIYNGNVTGFIEDMRMNRMVFRERASAGLIPGVRKAVW